MNQQENPYNAVNGETFEEAVLQNKKPVVVFFAAAWCGPCWEMLPVIKEMIEENDPHFDICSVDVDEEPELTGRYGIRVIPQYVVFRNGLPIPMERALVGAMGKKQLLTKIGKVITS
ncbi:MAG: thioredoxin family protein [Candidatus Moranbacteria bacterium]|nr:thioredoxin family protein [Candidatus Moranbacteria bacterium]